MKDTVLCASLDGGNAEEGPGGELRCYGFSLAGPYHIAHGIPCQDAHAVDVAGNYLIMAVADGVGSQESSDIGALTAVGRCVDVCMRFIGKCATDEQRLELLRLSFKQAYCAVLKKADERGISPGQMDCTLTCVAWDACSKRAFVGQSGDSGALCSHGDGSYGLLTEKQNTEEGAVYCLCFDDRWAFAVVEDVWSVMLCTDGVLDAVVASPRLKILADRPEINGGSLVDARMATAFLHPYLNPADSDPLEGLKERARVYLEEYSPALLDDDKTVVVGFSNALPGRMPDSYYEGPDWDAAEQELKRLLYAPSSVSREESGEGGRSEVSSGAEGVYEGLRRIEADQASEEPAATRLDGRALDADRETRSNGSRVAGARTQHLPTRRCPIDASGAAGGCEDLARFVFDVGRVAACAVCSFADGLSAVLEPGLRERNRMQPLECAASLQLDEPHTQRMRSIRLASAEDGGTHPSKRRHSLLEGRM